MQLRTFVLEASKTKKSVFYEEGGKHAFNVGETFKEKLQQCIVYGIRTS